MPALPVVGASNNTWGTELNAYLETLLGPASAAISDLTFPKGVLSSSGIPVSITVNQPRVTGTGTAANATAVPAKNTIAGGEITHATAIKIDNRYTQTADPADPSVGTAILIDWNPTLNYAGSAGPSPQTGWYGPRAAVELEGTIQWNINGGTSGGGVGFMDALISKNQPGQAKTFGAGHNFIAGRIFLGDGATATQAVGDWADGPVGYAETLSFTTGNTGTLTANEMLGFVSGPMMYGNTSVGTRVAFDVHDMNQYPVAGAIADALANITHTTKDTDAHVLTNNVGLRVKRMTGGTNNYGIKSDTQTLLYSDTATFTATPPSTIATNGTYTSNFANAVQPTAWSYAPTLIFQQAANVLAPPGHMFMNYAPTIKNAASLTGSLGLFQSFMAAPTFVGDTTATTATLILSFNSNVNYNRTSTGTFTADHTAYGTSFGVTTGCTCGTRVGYSIADATGAGTVTNQYGLDIGALTKGATKNRAIRVTAATGASIEMGLTTINDTTTTLPASTLAIYVKGGVLTFAYNDAGTMRFTTTAMTGTTTPSVWAHGTTGP